jgi:hypothetical protein
MPEGSITLTYGLIITIITISLPIVGAIMVGLWRLSALYTRLATLEKDVTKLKEDVKELSIRSQAHIYSIRALEEMSKDKK